jgi:hypothetical protein
VKTGAVRDGGRGITVSLGSGLMKAVAMRLGFWIIGVGLRRRGYKVLRGQRQSDGGRLEGPKGGGLPVMRGGVGWRREESELKTAWPDLAGGGGGHVLHERATVAA